MSEVLGQAELRKSPIENEHRRSGAQMIERGGWRLPSSYGDDTAEYRAVREAGVGVIDISDRGRFLVGGSEAVQFLNGLITNDMKTLEPNSWMAAVFPNVQGRLIASTRVMRFENVLSDRNVCPMFMLDTEAATHHGVFNTIQRFTLAGDFRVTDVTTDTTHFTVQGPNAGALMETLIGDDASQLEPNGLVQTLWQDKEVTVVRSTHTGASGFDLIIKADYAAGLWTAILDAEAIPVGHNTLELLRIEAGIPRYGIDMDETNVVPETALDDAVSYTKGCYVGQEIIARIKYRGHVAKRLTGFGFEGKVAVSAESKVTALDGKEIGKVTSVAFSPGLSRTVALGYVKYDYLAPGTEVRVETEGGLVEASVVELPFINTGLHSGGEAAE